MDTLVYIVVVLAAVASAASGNVLTGSFYGDSFLRLPLDDASSETDVRLEFRTYRPHGLLFLAGGNTDFCIIEMRNGMILVRIDLGSGEATLGSPPGLVFNDMRWHHLHLMRSEAEVQLKVDDIYTTTTNTPGRFFELNINHGVFLGNIAAFNDVFFGHFEEYRGCLRDVAFNSADVFHQAQLRNDATNLFSVTWDCSMEFGATSEQPISFLSNVSFIAFPPLNMHQELVRLTFDVRTRSRRALVLYNSGRLQSHDFIALEIVDDVLKLTLNKGNGLAELLHRRKINDGQWHQIEIIVSPLDIKLGVDGHRKDKQTNFGENRYLDLHGYMYIGGVSFFARAKAIRMGIESLSGEHAASGSLIGCIQNFKLNGVLKGFREAEITRDLRSECLWTFPCSASEPCIDGATCVEQGYYHYKCQCEADYCYKTGSTGASQTTSRTDIIHIQDVVAREDSSSLITTSNVNLLVDLAQVGLRSSAVKYTVVNYPQHGDIVVTVGSVRKDSSMSEEDLHFTQLDLEGERVSYLHDGTETTSDSIGLELEFLGVGDDDSAPEKLKRKYGFTLMVQIAQWNDKPALTLPQDGTLVMVMNTEVRVTPKIMKVTDKDDRDRDLEYSIQYQQGYDIGYFEIDDSLGVRARITSFTQDDVNKGRITFVHRGSSQQNIRVQVSDGKDMSEPELLLIHAVPLQLTLAANSGLDVASGTVVPITHANLSYATNAPSQDIDVRYTVTDPTYYGELQRQQFDDNQWKVTSSFTQSDIDQFRVRYVHYADQEYVEDDYFRYKVTAMRITTDDYEFLIRIQAVEVDLLTNSDLVLDGVKEMRVSGRHLRAVSSIPEHTTEDIVYRIVTLPRHGDIMIKTNGERVRLDINGNFTQEDINQNRIMYRLHRALFEPIHDHFQFQLSIPGDESNVFMYDIRYEPIDSDTMFVNNMLMDVMEGGNKSITKDDLYMETAKYKDFSFSVIDGPDHGEIDIVDPRTLRAVNKNVTSFTNKDIREGRVLYVHDDTENKHDHFDFTAIPIISQTETTIQEISEFTGTFDTQILLKNDNPPQRVVEKTFNVVANRGRVLTLEDIMYRDPDVDFDSDMLQYTRRAIPNGEIVRTSNHSEALFQFSQKELRDGEVYFQHSGANYGRSAIWVTDGQFYSTGLFEVRASDPYIRVVNKSAIVIHKGESEVISVDNLNVESNLDVDDKDVKFTVIDLPAHGVIKRNGMEKVKFNLADVKNGELVYEHDNTTDLKDAFKFQVKIDDIETEELLKIKIILDSHQQPPQVVNNKVMNVNEGEKVTIGKSDLLVDHEESRPRDIVYTVTRQPMYGRLSLRGTEGGEPVTGFTQEDVNRRKVHYTHTGSATASIPDSESDTFAFDVTNGQSALQELEFVLMIIPSVIPMSVNDFMVREGESRVLSTDVITVYSKYFLREGLDFVVVNEPDNGWIEDTENTGTPVLQFSYEQVQNEQIYYVHDGNDTTADDFSLMAKTMRSLNKQSNPHSIHITVLPMNDQPPKVTVNKRLEVWTGSSTPITSDVLRAVDRDSGPNSLMYIIGSPSNGMVALSDNPTQNVVNFTQAAIDMGKVLFVHKGLEKGEFEFQVNDGNNNDRRRVFRIQAKALELKLKNHVQLLVFPRIIQPLTSEHLLAVTNDKLQRQEVLYTLQGKPKFGVLIMQSNNSMLEVTSFTQRDINEGRMAYQHYAAMDGDMQYDKFLFEVSTPYAEVIKHQMFSITIAYDNINEDNSGQLITLASSSVEEGGEVTITKNNLNSEPLLRRLNDGGLRDPQIFFRISEPPQHGVLFVNGENATVATRFIQPDLDGGRVYYEHDHSDTLSDAFYFVLDIEHHLAGQLVLTPSKLEMAYVISILPINDQPFQLKTKYPFITLVQGFTANITSDILNTIDPDSPAEDITYHIVNGPTNGYMILREEPDIAVTTFTQQLINENRVVFIQDGSMESGAFYFKVSDGQFKPYFKVFNIQVDPLTLELEEVNDIKIIQGHSSVMLTSKNFVINTNGNRFKVFYNVTKPPMHGQLYMRDRPVRQFTQKDIDNAQITYIQTDLTVSHDFFEFIVYDMQNMVMRQRAAIKVKAQVVQGRELFRAPAGEAVTLGLAALDASSLAAITNDNPMYVITRAPRLGKIVKLVQLSESKEEMDEDDDEETKRFRRETKKGKKGKGRKKSKDIIIVKVPVMNFTHQDVAKGDIMYKANNASSSSEQEDGFAYIITARNAQPAPGEFKMVVLPPAGPSVDSAANGGAGAAPATPKPPQEQPETDEVEEASAEAKKGPDKLTIVYIVAGCTAFLIFLIIVIKCVRKRKAKKKQKQYEVQHMPHDDSRTPLAARHNAEARSPMDYQPPLSKTPPPPPPNAVPGINVMSDEYYHRAATPNIRSRSLSPPAIRAHDPEGSAAVTPQLPSRHRPHRDNDLSKSQPLTPRSGSRTSGGGGGYHRGRSQEELSSNAPPTSEPPLPPHPHMIDGSRTLPMCKVTPLGGYDVPPPPLSDGGGGGGGGSRDPSMTPKHEQVLFDWDNVDPELLQHCRKTNPVLHRDKYWV